ncbi:MAG: hypothetical protein WC562_06315 [Dehalococcoidia bacterium]
MTRKKGFGYCEICRKQFGYYMIHNGFNDSGYAYCDKCGQTCLLNLWHIPKGIPEGIQKEIHVGLIPESAEAFLNPCACGGTFRREAYPRCPHCNSILSPKARKYIEENARNAQKGWMENWRGIMCIIIEDKVLHDVWKEPTKQ